MAKLNGKQIALLQQAILDAFDLNDLQALLLLRLDRDLSQITPPANLRTMVLDVIKAAEREGWTGDLLDAIAAERPGVDSLQDLCVQLRAVMQAPSEQQRPSAPQAGLSSTERASLERQLKAQQDNLMLIEERLAEFVSPSDPANLQLVKSKQQIEARIAELEARLESGPGAQGAGL